MFDHVTIRVPDLAAARRFYTTVFDAIAFTGTPSPGDDFHEWNDFSIVQVSDQSPLTTGLHIGFVAPSREHVNTFWRELTNAGYQDDGPPGRRPQYSQSYYGAFVLDPGNNNSIEAVHDNNIRTDGGVIDHLWIRVADVAAAKRFYETIASTTGIRLRHDSPDRAQFEGHVGSFSLVDGTPTKHVHLAFPGPRPSNRQRLPPHRNTGRLHRQRAARRAADLSPGLSRRLHPRPQWTQRRSRLP